MDGFLVTTSVEIGKAGDEKTEDKNESGDSGEDGKNKRDNSVEGGDDVSEIKRAFEGAETFESTSQGFIGVDKIDHLR